MILLGVVYAALSGNLEAVTDAAINSCGEAISLCITMAGVMALWMGLMEIATQAGIVQRLTKAITPFLNYMFPHIPKDHPARSYIAANLIANVLGLGWACTPAGLKAMEALGQLEEEREKRAKADGGAVYGRAADEARVASAEMCDFLILNISSLQLIPVNMIAYRSQYGSSDPAGIIAPAILATGISTFTAIMYCKWKSRKIRQK